MPSFEVRVSGKKGPRTLEVIADSPEDAERLARRNGKVVSVKRQFKLDLSRGMTADERYTFMVRMSSMIGSRFGVGDGLRLMAATFPGRVRVASERMLERIESGMDMPSAMEQDRKNFPSTTTALVRAGTASGETATALRDAAQFEHKMAHAHKGSMKQVYSAMGSFVTAFVLMVGTTQWFGPMVMDNPMFATAPGVDIEFARNFGNWSTISVGVVMVFLALFAALGTVGRQIFPDFADKIIMKIPFYKDLILSKNNHVTLYKLGLLIGSGVRIEEALKLTYDSSPKGALKADLGRALKAVRSGQPWARAMDTLHPTDKAALSTSTDRKDISRTLDMLANQYSDLYINRISTFAPALSSLAAVFMSLGGLVMFVQTILPMLQMSANA